MLAHELLALANAYGEATGLPPSTVGRLAAGNSHVFKRLSEGHGCHSNTLAAAATWFRNNWPDQATWPDGVPR